MEQNIKNTVDKSGCKIIKTQTKMHQEVGVIARLQWEHLEKEAGRPGFREAGATQGCQVSNKNKQITYIENQK